MSVTNTSWQLDGKVRLWCPECDFRKKAKHQGAVVAAARRHVEATGHRVQLYRSQWRATEPDVVRVSPETHE